MDDYVEYTQADMDAAMTRQNALRDNSRTATLREVYDRAFYAALAGGLMACGKDESWPSFEAPINYCDRIALAAVRTHAARMAELEKEIANE